jgi:hypothetical protein
MIGSADPNLGLPLDRLHKLAAAGQLRVLEAMLALAEAPHSRGPVLADFHLNDAVDSEE